METTVEGDTVGVMHLKEVGRWGWDKRIEELPDHLHKFEERHHASEFQRFLGSGY